MILAIDIGQGTSDILLWDSQDSFENALQLVIPSASKRLAQMILSVESDIYCQGTVMGGSPLVKALKKKIKAGYKVYMTPQAAYSIRYHLDFVTDLGIEIVSPDYQPPDGTMIFTTGDFRFKWLLDLFTNILGRKPTIDGIGLAVQDHGTHQKDELAREVRLQFYKERLTKTGKLIGLGFRHKVPDNFPRLKAALDQKEKFFPGVKHFIIDTSPIAIIGALQDEVVRRKTTGKSKTVINFGNGHTLACVLDQEDKVLAFFEHHTGRIKQIEKFDRYLEEFLAGDLDSKKVIEDLGHGCYYLDDVPPEANENIIVIGPQRAIGKQSRFDMLFANPGGSMMMAGPIALVKALSTQENGSDFVEN